MSRPNIIFLHSHNTGQYIQPYGHSVPTPNLHRLAEEGVLFRHCFAANPTCSPSRASFLSGMYPHSCGMMGLAHRGFAMRDYALHVVATFKQAGYLTALSGVEHTAPSIDQVGYDLRLCDHDTNYPDSGDHGDVAQAAVEFLHRQHDRPFFLSVGLNETHRPFPKADPVHYPAEDARYCRPPALFPDTPATRADMADFKAAARIMDESYGRVLAALDETGLAENTLVCCFSDHGLQFPRHMCNLTDHGTAVYCILRGPGGFAGGQVREELVSLIDLAPTAYDVAGIARPEHVQGMSLRKLVMDKEGCGGEGGGRGASGSGGGWDSSCAGELGGWRDAVFSELNYHASYEPQRAVRTARYKYIRRYDRRERVVLANCDENPSKAVLLEHGWTEQPRWQEALFDLTFDPAECCNLAGSARHADTLRALRARLETWMRVTDDPIRVTGHIEPPRGARITPADAPSPRDPAVFAP